MTVSDRRKGSDALAEIQSAKANHGQTDGPFCDARKIYWGQPFFFGPTYGSRPPLIPAQVILSITPCIVLKGVRKKGLAGPCETQNGTRITGIKRMDVIILRLFRIFDLVYWFYVAEICGRAGRSP